MKGHARPREDKLPNAKAKKELAVTREQFMAAFKERAEGSIFFNTIPGSAAVSSDLLSQGAQFREAVEDLFKTSAPVPVRKLHAELMKICEPRTSEIGPKVSLFGMGNSAQARRKFIEAVEKKIPVFTRFLNDEAKRIRDERAARLQDLKKGLEEKGVAAIRPTAGGKFILADAEADSYMAELERNEAAALAAVRPLRAAKKAS
jgi:hypothetical protein